jgi:hypothetical protein
MFPKENKKPDSNQNGGNQQNMFGNQQQNQNTFGNPQTQPNNFGFGQQTQGQNTFGNPQTQSNFNFGQQQTQGQNTFGMPQTQSNFGFNQQQYDNEQQLLAQYKMMELMAQKMALQQQQQQQNFMNSSWGIYPQQGSFYGPQSFQQSFNNVQPSFQKQSLLQSFQNPNNGMKNFIPQTIHVKCKFNGENRRFQVDSSISLEELLDRVKFFFNASFKPEDVKVKYFDEDKDSVDINKQEDYIEGRAIAYRDPENVFRISVELKKNTIEVLNSNLSNLKIENKVEPVKTNPVQVIQKQTRDWTTELQFLKEMGFSDTQKNIQLLEQHKGEITSVVQILVSS